MSATNPYSASHQNIENSSSGGKASVCRARAIFYVHLLGVVLCAVASLIDTGFLHAPIAPQLLPYASLALVPLALSGIACPLAMAAVARRLEHRSITFRVGIVALDFGLSVFQCWALLPTVQ